MRVKKVGGNHIKIENRKLVFSYIFNKPGISRPEITAQTKLSAASVARITEELLDEGLIYELDSEAGNVGRRPTLLYVCGKNVPALAIELDRDKQVCAVADLTGNVQYRIERDFYVLEHSPEEMCSLIRDMVNEVMTIPEMSGKRFSGIGVALPGLIDMVSGKVLLSSQFHWHDVPLGAMLREMFPDMTVTLDNEMNARALAEYLYGKMRNEQNAVILGIGTGVGAGIIINGSVYRGNANMAGEVGHITMDASGKMCECGSYGCLQTYVADRALIEDAQRFKRDADIGDIIKSANAGEQWAASILDRFVKYTKTAISYFSGLLNPGVVVLSGQVIFDYPELASRLLRDYPSKMVGPVNTPPITISALGRDGSIIGAATELLYKVYEEYI
jgi:predicted NBD/HSP70 family sugar kinase